MMKPIDTLTDDEFAELVQRAASLPDAPPAAVRAAIKLWPKARQTTLGGLVESAGEIIHAVLSFDSWARPAVAFGMRSAGSHKRHLLYCAGERDVDLRIDCVAGAFNITGQVLGSNEAGTFELAAEGHAQGSNESRVISVDELGEFRLDGIEAGTYRLTLRQGNDNIVFPAIPIGEKPA
jgi:hypothetical protein